MTKRLSKFAGGTPLSAEGGGEVSAAVLQNGSKQEIFFLLLCSALQMLVVALGAPYDTPDSGLSYTDNCASLPARGQKIGERGGGLARRRYQRGRVFLRGKKGSEAWVGRWREDVIENGQMRRIERSEVLGSKSDFPTKRLAQRELEKRLAVVNDPRYRARPTATFAEFTSRWEATVLTQYKPSTQATLRSHIRKHLNPYFGSMQLRDIGPEEVQCFVSSVKVSSSKTKKNLFATFQMVWKTARTWGYVAHDATSGVVLPKRSRVARRFFSLVEVQRILAAAAEPLLTFLWLAVETGMRAGELCGLRIGDIDFDRSVVYVRQSAWRGKIQSPKSENAFRSFALSPGLLAHLAGYCSASRPNERGLLFATRNGTPWDANLLVKRKLYPLLDSLGIERGGLHAFRHTNSTLMDRLGVPLKVRQQRLGHSDPSLTLDVYTHVASEDDVRFAEQLDGILRPNAPKSKKEGVAPGEQPLLN
jgi:integrase